MKWVDGEIDGVVARALQKHTDSRGWLSELFREDELPPDLSPAMAYISVTHPGIGRGPHEHVDQTDLFGLLGPGNFRVIMWDNREKSPTYGHRKTMICGESNPVLLIIPPGVVHGYTNVDNKDAWVVNFPNRLFKGKKREQPVDETRYEGMKDSPFRLE